MIKVEIMAEANAKPLSGISDLRLNKVMTSTITLTYNPKDSVVRFFKNNFRPSNFSLHTSDF